MGAADPPGDATRFDHRLGVLRDHLFRKVLAGSLALFSKTIALVDVEHGEPLEEPDRARVGLVTSFCFVIPGGKLGSIKYRRAALAAPDRAACGEGLAEGKPALGGEAAIERGDPEQKDVDPRIAAARRRIGRQVERRRGVRPGLHPGDGAGFQVGDDPRGHFAIKVGLGRGG